MTSDEKLRLFKEEPQDGSRFSEWYKAIYPSLYYYALRVTAGHRQAAEDHCQDAIVAFVTGAGLDKVRSAAEARAYIQRSIFNQHIDHLRKESRQLPLSPDTEPLAPSANAAESTEAIEVYETLRQTLGPDDQKVLAMMLAGESLTEIAQACDIKYSTAGSRVHRIRKTINKLRES